MKNIVLLGFMGSGKSTIAKMLANRLDKSLVDSDEHIASQMGLSVREIFYRHGEEYFRSLERDFIETFSKRSNFIIATGGGMPIFNDISLLGARFYLRSDFNTILHRINTQADSSRPLFDDINLAGKIYNDRMDKYELSSDYIIDSTDGELKVVESILAIIYRELDI